MSNGLVGDVKKYERESLERFLARPETKTLMALIPASETAPEALKSLLESLHANAFAAGSIAILMPMLERSFKKEG